MIARLLVALVLLVASGTAHAFELLRVNHDPCARGDQNLFWRNATMSVSVDPLPEPYHDLAIEAWEDWNANVERFRFTAGSGPACTIDGVAAMAIADQPCGLSEFGDAIAITRSRWNGDGTLVDADVTFKAGTPLLTDENVFRHVAMHELGHVLGLAHSDACGGSGNGTLMRTHFQLPTFDAPQADDINGANAIYPGGSGNSGSIPAGTNSCAITSPQRGQLAPPLIVMALLLLLKPIGRGGGRPRRPPDSAPGSSGN